MNVVKMLKRPCPLCHSYRLTGIEMRDDATGNIVPGVFCNECKIEFYHTDDSTLEKEEAVENQLAEELATVWNLPRRLYGHWGYVPLFNEYECSCCYGRNKDGKDRYCSKCGALMSERRAKI